MEAIAVLFSTLSLVGTVFLFLLYFGIINIGLCKQGKDLYSKYRNEDGLLGRKKSDS